MSKLAKTLFLLSFTALTAVANAQQSTDQLVGKVISTDQKPVESVLVSLLNAKDSSVAKTAVTDKNGQYSFSKVSNGNYLLSANLIGYKKLYSQLISFNAATDKMLPELKLEPGNKSLSDVTVTSKKPLVQQLTDRLVVNVEASPTNSGSTALEVLEKSPGVTVDKDGNISLKGKEGVVVFIDGRPSYLSGQDLANLLKNMQSSQLDQIEIMTNPPAKYDAAGKAGVINIKTKKSKIFGFNGSVTLGYGQGKYSRTNQNVNLNYRKDKINLFGNFSHSERERYQDLEITRRFVDNAKQLVSYFNQHNLLKNSFNNWNGKIGLDYFATKKTTLGVVFSGFNSPGSFSSDGDIYIYSPTHVLNSQTKASAMNTGKWTNFSTNFNVRHLLDTAGREISFDADYLNYNNAQDQALYNAFFNGSGVPTTKPDTLIARMPQGIHIYSAKLDYTHPLKKGARFEAGIKSSYVTNDANAIYDSVIYGSYVRDYNRTNHFIYKENINAAYVNFNKPFGEKFSIQLGLRAEHTNAKGDQVTTNIQFSRNYVQLFPTAYFQYKAGKNNSFVLNYGKRIRRPDYSNLNPFVEYLDKYTYEQGNPYLKPEFSHNIELSHTFKGFLTTTLNYTKSTDLIQQVILQNEVTNEVGLKNDNIASQRQYGLSVNAGNEYTKWWSGNIYMNVYANKFSGVVNNEPVTFNTTTAMFNVSQQFKFGKGWSGELSGFYRTEGLESMFIIKPFGMVNAGVSKQILKNKGSIRLNVRDVFWTQKIKGSVQYGKVDANFRQYGDDRIINLTFSYRFSKGKAVTSQRKRGGAEDEQSRVGAGNGK
ncbi:MAG: TonB-dependent receptor [Sediminibacterium sp.]